MIYIQESNRLEYLIPKKTSLRHRLPMGDQGFIDFVAHLLEVNSKKRPSASEALKHPWLSYPYEPISSWSMWRFFLLVIVSIFYPKLGKLNRWKGKAHHHTWLPLFIIYFRDDMERGVVHFHIPAWWCIERSLVFIGNTCLSHQWCNLACKM